MLAELIPSAEREPKRLHAAMRYAVLGGGKRLRPLLVYTTGHCCGAELERLDAPAAAVELIHAYSLIHDDLPAMDDDELRRGRPTCHIAFDEATAILAGDALQALAFEVLLDERSAVDPPTRARMGLELARACGTGGLAGGQALDLAAVGRPLGLDQIAVMHRMKTAALIRCSVLLGALAAGPRAEHELQALSEYGWELGLAFQIVDDILDVEGETAVIGKPRGSDAALGKPTYPAVVGIPQARALAEAALERALAALDTLPGSHLAVDDLRRLAHYTVRRAH